jgi:hypothetical protein
LAAVAALQDGRLEDHPSPDNEVRNGEPGRDIILSCQTRAVLVVNAKITLARFH